MEILYIARGSDCLIGALRLPTGDLFNVFERKNGIALMDGTQTVEITNNMPVKYSGWAIDTWRIDGYVSVTVRLL